MRRSFVKYVSNLSVRKQFKAIAANVDKLIWPPRSLVSGQAVPGPGLIEAEHWKDFDFITGPVCVICGVPFKLDVGEDQQCPACIARPPHFDSARAALAYNDASRKIILRFKHSGDRTGLNLMVSWIVQAMPEMIAKADLILPVPLHYSRLIQRGFNQSVWLAAGLSRASKTKMLHHGVKRVRATPSQAGRSASGRRRNVQGAFAVSARAAERIQGKHILLVDDVFTTGATVNACARVLKRSGAASVEVATVLRVVRPADPTI